MKKIIALILFIAMTVSLMVFMGCGSDKIPSAVPDAAEKIPGDAISLTNAISEATANIETTEYIPSTSGTVTTCTTTAVVKINASDYRLCFELSERNTIPFMLFACAMVMNEGNIAYMDGVGIFYFRTDTYEEKFPVITLGEEKTASIYCDEYSKIGNCAMYDIKDVEMKAPLKCFDDVSCIDLSDAEKGEYYIMFNMRRLGNKYGNFTDTYNYKCFVKIIVE